MQISEGELLRRMRALAGYTQTQMAKMLNVDKSVISRIESGVVAVTLKRAMVWADKTGNQDMLLAFVAGSQVVAETLIHTQGIIGFASMLLINFF